MGNRGHLRIAMIPGLDGFARSLFRHLLSYGFIPMVILIATPGGWTGIGSLPS